jgi:hypothetical protein
MKVAIGSLERNRMKEKRVGTIGKGRFPLHGTSQTVDVNKTFPQAGLL